MDWQKMAKQLQGFQTVSSICKILSVKEKTAINYIYELRKRGYVKTTRGKGKTRMYEIFPYPKKEMGYPGLFDIINKHSPVKIVKPYEHRVYTRRMSVEEAIARAVETQDFRTILASLGLFRHVKDWKELHGYAKEKHVERFVGALYDLSRKVSRVKQMDKRTRNALLHSTVKSKYIIPKLKSKDFREIEKRWGVFLPFNKEDLRRYKE